jgi:AsmA protein
MRKGARISVIVVAAVAALLVVLGVTAKLLITPERVTTTVVRLAERYLHRTLKLGEIKVSIFSGIVLQDLAVMEKDGKEPFLQAHEVKLRYQFWPLLHKKVVVDAVSLDGLKLRVVRMPDGTFNYSDITAKKVPPEQEKPTPKREINLALHLFEVKGSEISFEDRKVESGSPALYKVSDLNLSAKQISLQEPFPITVGAKIFSTLFEVQGKIANASGKPSFDGTIRVPQGDLKKLVAALPPALAAKARPLDPTGAVKVDLKVAGPVSAPVKELLKSGTIDLSNVQVTASGQRPTVAGHFGLNGDAISTQDTTVNIFATTFQIQGTIANASEKPTFDGTIRVPQGDLKKLVAALPPALAAKARPLDPTGTVKVDLKVAGPVSAPVKELLKSGTIDLSNVQVTSSGQRPTVAGHFRLNGDAISTQDTTVILGPNKLNIALAVAHLMAKPLVVSSTVKADTFSLDPFLKKEAGAPAPGGAQPEPEPKNLPVQASGTVQIGKTSYKGLPITGLYTKYRLDSNVLTVEDLRGNVAGGSFSDRGRIDLGRKGYAYSTRLALRGVQADQVVKALDPKNAGKLFGAMALNADVTGAGMQTAAMMKNATGHGDFNITGGRLVGTPLLREISRFLNAPSLGDVHFTTFAGTFRLSGGNLLLDSTIASKDLQTSPKGTVGLISKKLALSLPTKISPTLLPTKLPPAIAPWAGKLLAGGTGSAVIPLKVTGTLSAPKVGLSTSAIAAPVGKALKENLQENVEQTIKKPGEVLQKELKGIFGR